MGNPARTNSVIEIYQDVPTEQRERLFSFRATHPYHHLSTGDASWRYIACGEGKRTLLFLPGAFLKADMWFNQVLALESDYQIIAPDAFALQGLFDLEVVCDVLAQSLDAEGIEGATVIGLSAGGGVAQALLQRYPDRVDHVVFSHCGVLEHSAEAERQSRRILMLVRLLPLFVIRSVLKRMTTGRVPASSEWVVFHEAYVKEAILDVDRATVVRFLRSSLETRRRISFDPAILDRWAGSALILSSQDDALSQQSVERLQSRYPMARVELLAEGGHHTFLFFPDDYTSALMRFLEDTP